MSADDTSHEQAAGRRTTRRLRAPGRSAPPRRASRVPYPLAAAAVGLLVALLGRGLILGGEQTCDAVHGTTNCGAAGGFMLLAILALMVYAGVRLLRVLSVPEPTITSLLGVALLAIIVLAVLADVIFSTWMWVVLPLVAAATYAFSAWAAARLSEWGGG